MDCKHDWHFIAESTLRCTRCSAETGPRTAEQRAQDMMQDSGCDCDSGTWHPPAARPDDRAKEADTEELLCIGQLPEPLRLAAMLEKTMQWPLHGKAADCLRKLHAELEAIKQAEKNI